MKTLTSSDIMKRLPKSVHLLILLAACTRVRPQVFEPRATTRDRYEDQVLRSDAANSKAYADWSNAGRHALRASQTIKPSFREVLSFSPGRSDAVGYRLQLQRGQRVQIDIERNTGTRVFAEVFEEIGGGALIYRLVKTAPVMEQHIDFEATTDGPHVLRVQPEMLKGGNVVITVTTTASLTFPVLGKTRGAIKSFFGDARDGGKRDHEGVDIFAPAGTDVVAVAPGIITSVATTPIGGNVVWQEDPARGVSYYYAHLKTQHVVKGDRVEPGSVIGTVGNTGNAKNSPSHLHFAVYKPGRIAIDPVPFLFDQSGEPAGPVLVDTRPLGEERWLKGASGEPVYVIGAVRDRYHVISADGSTTLVRASDISGPSYSKAAH